MSEMIKKLTELEQRIFKNVESTPEMRELSAAVKSLAAEFERRISALEQKNKDDQGQKQFEAMRPSGVQE